MLKRTCKRFSTSKLIFSFNSNKDTYIDFDPSTFLEKFYYC